MKKNRTILVLDAFCSAHVGNDVLLDSSLQVIRSTWPDASIVIHAKEPESFKPTLGLKCRPALFSDLPSEGSKLKKLSWTIGALIFMTVQALNAYTLHLPPHWFAISPLRRNALKDIHSADIAVSIGGEMINDDFRKTLPFYLFLFILPTRWKGKTVIFPQSIGPLRRRWTRAATRWALKRCAAVTARDKPSLEELTGLGLDGNQALFSPDVGVDQPMASRDEAHEWLKQLGITMDENRAWIGITPSNWTEEGITGDNYLETLAKALIQLAQQLPIGILIMPANMPLYGCRPKDRDTAVWLKERLEGNCPVYLRREEVISARLFKSVTSVLDLFISTRMHAAILATNAPTPTITINTQRKLFGYMSNIGQERYSIDIDKLTVDGLLTTMQEMLNHREGIRNELKKGHDVLHGRLEQYSRQLMEIIP